MKGKVVGVIAGDISSYTGEGTVAGRDIAIHILYDVTYDNAMQAGPFCRETTRLRYTREQLQAGTLPSTLYYGTEGTEGDVAVDAILS